MKFKYYNMLFGVLLMASCDKQLEIAAAPDFDVTTQSTTYKVGDEIKFNITDGDADEISFYSGEVSKNYDHKDGRVIDISGAGVTMEFQNSVQVGSQANQLSVWYSTDFNGDYSSLEKVKLATWVDITSRFSPLATNATFVPVIPALPASQDISKDISDLRVPGKPIYIAYKYTTKPQAPTAANGIARQWFIQAFAIKSKVQFDGTTPVVLANQANAGFRIVDDNKNNDARALSSISATRITLQGNLYRHAGLPIYNPDDPMYDPTNPIYNPRDPAFQPTTLFPKFVPFDPNSPYNDPESEHWAISKAINLDKTEVEPDWSESIKNYTNPPMQEFKYIYTKPGTYKATFIASKNSIKGSKEVVKVINLTITP